MGVTLDKEEVEELSCEDCKGWGWFGGTWRWRSPLVVPKGYFGEAEGWYNGFLTFARTGPVQNQISHDAPQQLMVMWTHGGLQCALGNAVLQEGKVTWRWASG